MYKDLDSFERALMHFGTRVDVIIALEMGDKIDSETAYKRIKEELKELKKVRKKLKTNDQQSKWCHQGGQYARCPLHLDADHHCWYTMERKGKLPWIDQTPNIMTYEALNKREQPWAHPESDVSKTLGANDWL